MHFPNWLRPRRPQTIHRHPTRICRFVRLQLEALEERITPTGPITIQAADAAQLQTAVTTADGNAGQQYVIQLTGTSPYNLTTELDVTNTAGVTITGSSTVLNAAAGNRVFQVASGASLTLQNLTVEGGNVPSNPSLPSSGGGGILVLDGTLALTNVVVQSNSVRAADGSIAQGGGVFASGGTLTITHSTIQNNTARGGDGSIPTGLSENGHTPINNGGAGYGGGIFVSGGTLTITNSTIQHNTARGGDGIAGTTSNLAGDGGAGYGGGVCATTGSNTGIIQPRFGSTISPYYLRVSQFTITNSTISANVSRGGLGGAGFSGDSGVGGSGGYGYGGGVYATNSIGSINLKNNSISGNQVFGGRGGTGFGSNTGGKGGDVFGGGSYVVGGTANLTNNSVIKNAAAGGSGGNGGIGSISLPGGNGGAGGDVFGGGLDAAGGDSSINNTVALNTGVGGGGGNGGNGGSFASGGHGGNGGSTSGGGIQDTSSSGQNSYLNNTLAFNNATGGNGGSGGLANSGRGSAAPAGTAGTSSGGGLYVESNAPIFTNNLLQRNMAASSGPDYFGSVDSAATNNFVSNTSGATTFNPTNNILNNSTNQLGTLTTAPNGTSYYPLSSLLPIVQSINGGTNTVLSTIATAEGVPQSQATDQIGNPRIVSPNDTIDIGAVEFQGFLTTTLASSVSVPYTILDPQPLSNTTTLTANLTDSEGIPINEGQVQFVVTNSSGAQVGVKLIADVHHGQASATFIVPPQTALGNYTITAQYSDNSPNPIFASSSGTGTLTVAPSPTTVTVNNVSVFYTLLGELDTVTAYVLGNPQTVGQGFLVNEGFVTLSVSGQTMTVPVVNSVATATFNIPLIAEIQFTHSITAAYSPSDNNYLASSSTYTINEAQIIMDFLIQLMILEFITNSMSGH